MRIDFERTEAELTRLINETVFRLKTEYPDAVIKRLGLWGLAFPRVAKVLVDVDDKGMNIGRDSTSYEYVENEFGMGVYFEWWPDLYALEDGDKFEITFKDDWKFEPALLIGDDAINVPLFALFMTVLNSAALENLKLSNDFSLTAEIGAHWLTMVWPKGDAPNINSTISYLHEELRAAEAGLRPKNPATPDAFKHRVATLTTGRSATVNSIAFSADDRTLISFGAGGVLERWDTQTGKLKWQSDATDHHSMAYCANAGIAVTYGMNESMTLWNVTDGRIIREIHGHEDWVCSAAISNDGKHLASGDDNGQIRLWREPFGEKSELIAEDLRIIGQITFSADGRLLAHVSNNGDESVAIYDLVTGATTPISVEHEPWPSAVSFSADGKMLAIGSSRKIDVWDLHNERLLHSDCLDSKIAQTIEFSPDSSILVGGGQDRAIVFWDAATGQRRLTISNPLKRHTIRCLAFVSDGKRMASANSDGTIDLWDMDGIRASL